MGKIDSILSDGNICNDFKMCYLEDIKEILPKRIEAADEQLCMDNLDKVQLILRNYDWNLAKVSDKWWDN